MRVRSVLLVSAALFAANTYAQEFRGRIQGAVLDSSQSAVAGASVSIRNADTGVVATRMTNDTGHYLFASSAESVG